MVVKLKKKNLFIELCRFIAAICIMLHHTETMGLKTVSVGGWIFVEFFFILTGYFMTRHFDNYEAELYPEKEVLLYTLGKTRRILPFATVGICIGFFTRMVSYNHGLISLLEMLLNLPTNILLFAGLGLTSYNFDGPLWYISCIMITMPILILAIIKYRQLYKYIASWTIPLILYMIMFAVRGNIYYWDKQLYLHCLLRAFAGLMAGSVTFYISEKCKCISIKTSKRIIFTVIEVLAFAIMVIFAIKTDCRNVAFPMVLLSMIVIGISFSRNDYVQDRIPLWVDKLGELSVPLFCVHKPVFEAVKLYCKSIPNLIIFLTGFVLSLALSVVLVELSVSWGLTSLKKHKHNI